MDWAPEKVVFNVKSFSAARPLLFSTRKLESYKSYPLHQDQECIEKHIQNYFQKH